jgi:hypothetical protein
MKKPRKTEKITKIFFIKNLLIFFLSLENLKIFSISASCSKLHILDTPKTVAFNDASDLNGGLLTDVFAAVLGYSVESDAEWNGLTMKNPFQPASAVVSVIVEGDELDLKVGISFFPRILRISNDNFLLLV